MPKLVKRPEIVSWLNITPTAQTEDWALIGNGMTSGSYSYDVNETSETYIVNDNATTTVDGYAVSMDGEMKCLFGDEVYDYINTLRYNLATGSNAESKVLLVDKYDFETTGTPEVTRYKAQVFNCSISVSAYGGDGGVTPTIGFKINLNGDPIQGTVTLSNGVPTFVATA